MKQACRDESIVSLFFSPITTYIYNIYIYIYIYTYIYKLYMNHREQMFSKNSGKHSTDGKIKRKAEWV